MSDRRELEDAIREFFKVRNDKDIEAIMAMLDPACSFRIVGNDRLGRMTQRVDDPETMRVAVRALIADWDLSNVSIISLHVDGETIFAHRAGQIRYVPSNVYINTEFLDKVTFRDGRIVDFVEFVDTLMVADTIGLLTA
jgi:ketosteroid isomerase-like protein